jgi:hypothetical protein
MRGTETLGMLLSFSFEPDLSHTSILYYYYHIYVKEIFDYWIRIVNKNQNIKLSEQTRKPHETQPKIEYDHYRYS